MNKYVKKLNKSIINYIKENWGFLLACAIIIFLGLFKLPYNLYIGGGILNMNNKIEIEGAYEQEGSFNLAYVRMGKANIPMYLLSYIFDWDREPTTELLIDENDSSEELWAREQIYLQESIDNAIINAYRLAGKEVNINDYYFETLYVLNEDCDLKNGDIILKINGYDVDQFDDTSIYLKDCVEGDVIKILVLRDGKEIECHAKLYILGDSLKMGVYFVKRMDYTVDPKVSVKFSNRDGGSSGGFMLSLNIYNKLVKEDLTHGMKIVGTGTIDVNGNIGEIDGVKYKLKGAVSKKADIFFVCNSNLEEALKEKEKNNYKIDIVEVNTLEEAVRYLESR